MAVRNNCVTLFSSISQIARSLQEAAPDLPLVHIVDDALGGYGGTVTFDPANLQPSTRQELAQARILITEPAVLAALLKDNPHALPRLEWCQSTYAGVDPLLELNSSSNNMTCPSFTVTRFAGKFGPPIAEWCLARIIGHERQFALTTLDQQNQAWAGSGECVTVYRYLSDLTLVILGGCGDIGRSIASAAQAFGMRRVAYTRKAPVCVPAVLDECTTDLPYALQQADYIVSVLPSTPLTKGLLSGDTLEAAGVQRGGRCPVFINVGRGDVINESSLIAALDRKFLSAAILDVFEEEPLPVDSPLWTRPDVVVSPHVSGVTRGQDAPALFLENYDRFLQGRELRFVVDWSKGY